MIGWYQEHVNKMLLAAFVKIVPSVKENQQEATGSLHFALRIFSRLPLSSNIVWRTGAWSLNMYGMQSFMGVPHRQKYEVCEKE